MIVLKKLERIQERAPRAVSKGKAETYFDLLSSARLSTVYQGGQQSIATLMLKNGLVPSYIKEILHFPPPSQRI